MKNALLSASTDIQRGLISTLTSIFISIFFISCSEQKPEKETLTGMADFEWLLGSWESSSDSFLFGETWMKVNDSTMAGIGYFIQQGDTVASEQIGLVRRMGNTYYIPAVSNQNAGEEVVFVMRDKSVNDFVFMNPNHDFPQQIRYTRFEGDSMEAVISGRVNGELHSQRFPMKRHK